MTDSRVAKRYARALFNVALKQDILQSVEDDLSGICAVIQHSKELQRFIKNPNATREQKLHLLEKTFSDRVTALTMHAIRLLLKRRRENTIQQLRLEFVQLRRDHDKVSYLHVTSARPLDSLQRESIVNKIQGATGRRIEADFDTDEKLIGGVKVMFDNFVLDGTARGYLDRMRDKILYDLLKQS